MAVTAPKALWIPDVVSLWSPDPPSKSAQRRAK
jgi:hypothetical protein